MQRLLFDGESHGRMAQACRTVGGPPSVVKALLHLSPAEPRPMRDLADHWGCDASYVTSVADSLEAQGLAERRPHPTDRRIKTLVLTTRGAEARAQILDLLWEPPPAFTALTDDEQETLRDLLAKVAEADEVLRTSAVPRIGL
jgi:MarR family transcriptional regulator, organic hydroperoxide resistance regulator